MDLVRFFDLQEEKWLSLRKRKTTGRSIYPLVKSFETNELSPFFRDDWLGNNQTTFISDAMERGHAIEAFTINRWNILYPNDFLEPYCIIDEPTSTMGSLDGFNPNTGTVVEVKSSKVNKAPTTADKVQALYYRYLANRYKDYPTTSAYIVFVYLHPLEGSTLLYRFELTEEIKKMFDQALAWLPSAMEDFEKKSDLLDESAGFQEEIKSLISLKEEIESIEKGNLHSLKKQYDSLSDTIKQTRPSFKKRYGKVSVSLSRSTSSKLDLKAFKKGILEEFKVPSDELSVIENQCTTVAKKEILRVTL